MKNIKNILKSNKSLIENFSFLSLFQIFNLLLPFFSYPYLLRVLGVEVYGTIVFAQAIIGYFVVLISFGFSISATKEVSIHRHDKEKLSEIVSSVLVIKFLLFGIVILCLVPLLFFFKDASENKILYLTTLWLCVSEILFPSFYFQGIEKMKYISIISLAVRSISVVLIFVLIRSKDDYLLVPALYMFGALLSGISALYVVFYSHSLRFYIPETKILKYYFKESIPIFLSNVSVQLYVSTNKVLIGLFLGMAEVSYYDMAEKILSILRIPQGILSQTVFPKVSHDKDIRFIKKVFNYSLILNLFLFLGLFLLARFIIVTLGGEQMLPSLWVVRGLGLTLPLIAISNIFGTLILIPFGFSKIFSKIIILSGVIFIMQFILVWIFQIVNIYTLCGITITTEIFVSYLMFYYINKNNLWRLKNLII